MKIRFVNSAMETLSAELAKGVARFKQGYIDAAEALFRIVDPTETYPVDFVRYRITDFQDPRQQEVSDVIAGEDLRDDLKAFIMAVSESSDLSTTDYDEPVYKTAELAAKFNISTKTVQRWRGGDLIARRLVFPDGKRRVAFCERSVEWFLDRHTGLVDRSSRFSHLTDTQRHEMVSRARTLASGKTFSGVTRQIAREMNRAVETIRTVLRHHDEEHPGRAIFTRRIEPLSDVNKQAIYQAYLRGLSVASLGRHYNRTRASIYRIVNEMRARVLLEKEMHCVYNPQFDLPYADSLILPDSLPPVPISSIPVMPPAAGSDLSAYLQSLYTVPLLKPAEERDLFRRYNYLKHKADRLRSRLEPGRVRTAELRRIEKLLIQANLVKNRIVQANLRLVVSIAKKHVGRVQTLGELISDGNLSLIQAAERFDYARGNRFSTYASWAITRNFARSVPRAQTQRDHFVTGYEELIDLATSSRSSDAVDVNIRELRESIDSVLAQLTSIERAILRGHFGLDDQGKTSTLEQLGRKFSISKERVRQIELRALRKLEHILAPQQSQLVP
jgi:RNA polymerase primary sigma factor